MQRNTYFYAMQVGRKPRVHFCIQEWGTGHRRTFTDSGGVTCTLGKRTVGQAGPESEWWEPGWGVGGIQDARMEKAGGTNTHAQAKTFSGESNAHPRRVRGGWEDAICKPRGRPRVLCAASPGPGLFTLIAVIPQDPLDSSPPRRLGRCRGRSHPWPQVGEPRPLCAPGLLPR